MPSFSNLARPMIATKYLETYVYKIKKIEIVEAQNWKHLTPRKIKYLEIYPIESKYWILFTDGYSGAGLPVPLQDVRDIQKKFSETANIITRKQDEMIEISFIGNKTIGHAGQSLIATIKVDNNLTTRVYEKLMLLKQVQYDSRYWTHYSLYLANSSETKESIDIYPNAPFLVDGEEMVWQSVKYEIVDKQEKVSKIDVVTNYRIFQYDYHKHHGDGILLPLLDDMQIEERPTTEAEQIGSYFISSYNLTGIKEAGTTKIIGDLTFNSQDKTSITFNQITDPEMLSTAVRRLKNKRIINRIDNKYQINDLTGNKQEGIVCNKCQHSNSPDSNFCNKCGNSLTTSCKKCGHSNISESLFCSKCGTKF